MQKNIILLVGFLVCFFMPFIAVQAQPISVTIQPKRVAGIEVGSKGVKLSVLEIEPTTNSVKTLKDTSVNTDFVSYTPQTYEATLNAFADLYNYAKNNWKLPAENIATAISSGVKAQSDKQKKQLYLNTFIDAFRIKINEETRAVEIVDVLKESILSHYGIVSDAERYSVFLIDIGSGNTKGGYFSANNNFVMFQIPSGTKSTANLMEKRTGTATDFKQYVTNVNTIVDSLEKAEIIYAVNASGAYPNTTTMAMSGGIAWAVATLMQPEKASTPFLDITYKDLRLFRDNLIKFEKDIPDTNKVVIKGLSTEKVSTIRKEVSRVVKVFDTKSLLAGSSLMLKIMRQFETEKKPRKFRLIKNGQVGWITGYILNKGGLGVK